MAEKIIRRAEDALKRGDMVGAVIARKALACTIRMGGHVDIEYLVQKHEEIYNGIGELESIGKQGSLS